MYMVVTGEKRQERARGEGGVDERTILVQGDRQRLDVPNLLGV